MRTVIYVHQPSTVTIQTTDPHESDVLMCRYNRTAGPINPGTHQLERGIYLAVSRGKLDISGGHVTIELLTGDKDAPPDPRAQVLGLEPGATAESFRTFLDVTKGITVGAAPAGPASPDGAAAATSKITDEPDGI